MAERPGFYFCVCPDGALTKQHVEELLETHRPCSGGTGGMLGSGSAGERRYEREAYWGDDGLTPAYWETLQLTSMLGPPKALVLRNAQTLKVADWRALSETLTRPLDAFPIFCVESPFERGKPKIPKVLSDRKLWKFAKKKGWLWQSPGLTRKDVSGYLGAWSHRMGLTFAPGAERALADVLPADGTALEAELAKVALIADDGGVIPAAAASLVSHEPEMDVFAFLNSAMAAQGGRETATVWREVLNKQVAGDSMLFGFLSLLAREARLLGQLLAGEEVKLPPFVVSKKEGLARRLGAGGIARLFDLAFTAELAVKSGERTPEQAMEHLLAGLSSTSGR